MSSAPAFVVTVSAVWLSAAILFYLFFSAVVAPRTVLHEQLDFYRRAWEEYYGRNFRVSGERLTSRLVDAVLEFIGRLSQALGVSGMLQNKLERSGLTINIRRFVFFHFTLASVAGALGYWLFNWFIALLIVAAAAFLPIIYLSLLENRRRARLETQLPELLTMVAELLKVGHGFYQAVDVSVKEMEPPIAYEFKKVLMENKLGISFEQALDDLAARVGSSNFDWLVVSIKIQRETGGNLAEILEMLARTIREREELNRHVKTLTAEGRLSAFILIGLPFLIALALYIINPDYISLLFTNTVGLVMLAVAGFLMLIGIFWLRAVITIDV